MDSLTIKLLSPIDQDGVKYEQLTLRELTVGQLEGNQIMHGSKTGFEQDVHFFALSCGVSPEVIRAMKQRDWTRLKAKYWEELGNVQSEPENFEQ